MLEGEDGDLGVSGWGIEVDVEGHAEGGET